MSIQAPNTMLLGAVGSGKSYCLRTLIDAGLELFVLQTEPSEVLDDLPKDKCHLHYVAPMKADWKAMISMATKINTMTYESLLKVGDPNRSKHQQWIQVLNCVENFTDSRTGQSYGDVTEWDASRAFVIDSLTGLSKMAMSLVVGGKPTPAQADWGMAMAQIEGLVDTLCTNTKCWFVLTGHLEPERDEVAGTISMMPATLGRKLPPKLPRFFSDVIHCTRAGSEFFWSTATANVDTKARNLPLGSKLKPDFTQIMRNWLERQGA